jgi:hypothetical protein
VRGPLLRPDGKNILTLEQAAKQSGRHPELLRRAWLATWGTIATDAA